MRIHLFHTTDTHSHMVPNQGAHSQLKIGSTAQLATFFETQLANIMHPILIDTGDFLQGSPLASFVESTQFTLTHPIIDFFNQYHYDAVVLGNHELDYAPHILAQLLAPLHVPILSANVFPRLPNVFTHKIIERSGVRLLLVGLTIPLSSQDYHLTDTLATFAATLKQIEPTSYDCLICCYHGGFQFEPTTGDIFTPKPDDNIGNQLLTQFPMIDLLLTGHQHKTILGKFGSTYYSQAGCYGNCVQQLQLEFSKQPGRWQLEQIDATCHHLSDIMPSQTLMANIAPTLTAASHWLSAPLLTLTQTFPVFDQVHATIHGDRFINLLHDFQKNWGNADISAITIPKAFELSQPLTRHHVFAAFAYEDLLTTIAIRGVDLLTGLQRIADFFTWDEQSNTAIRSDVPDYFYDLWSGLTYSLIFTDDNLKVVEITAVGTKPFDPTATYHVVLSMFRSQGGGGYHGFENHGVLKKANVCVQTLFTNFLLQLSTDYVVHSTTAFSITKH
ncbi:MAG: bifunctional metallophosphatase/5'-nucleotidase [Culicoidibacterales bacterium]